MALVVCVKSATFHLQVKEHQVQKLDENGKNKNQQQTWHSKFKAKITLSERAGFLKNKN
jgi:hypothetical protein